MLEAYERQWGLLGRYALLSPMAMYRMTRSRREMFRRAATPNTTTVLSRLFTNFTYYSKNYIIFSLLFVLPSIFWTTSIVGAAGFLMWMLVLYSIAAACGTFRVLATVEACWVLVAWSLLPIVVDFLAAALVFVFLHALLRPRSASSVAFCQLHAEKKDILGQGNAEGADEYSDGEEDARSGQERQRRLDFFGRQRTHLMGKYKFRGKTFRKD